MIQTSAPESAPARATTSATLPPREGTPLTLAALTDRYMAAYAGRDHTRTLTLAWWCSRLGERLFAGITDDDVFAGLEELRTRPARVYAGLDADNRPVFRAKGRRRDSTINRYHAALAALFTWASKRRIAPRGWENPACKIERPPENNQVVRFLTDDERARLLEACRASAWPRLYLIVLMAITTGARRGELVGLRWRHVDLERAIAHVATTKNGQPRTLPLLPAVLAELVRFRPLGLDSDDREKRERCCNEPVFSGRSRSAPAKFNSAWRVALAHAGIENFRFHDLRHTCASYLAQSGASLLEIADVLGHRQLAMVKRYAHLTVLSKTKLVNRVLGEIR